MGAPWSGRFGVDIRSESSNAGAMDWCPACEHALTPRSKGFLECEACGRCVLTWKVMELRYFGIVTQAFRERLVASDRVLFCPGCKDLTFEICEDPVTGVEVQRCDPCGLVSFAAGDRQIAARGNMPEPHQGWDGTLGAPGSRELVKGARAARLGLAAALVGGDPWDG